MVEGLRKFNIRPERISAIDGKTLDEQQVTRLAPPLNSFLKLEFPRELTKGEIGCFLSHRKAWKRFLESEDDWALIMEDDVRFSSKAIEYIKDSKWIPDGVNLIRLNASSAPGNFAVTSHQFSIGLDAELIQPFFPPALVSACYLISRRYAQEAVEASEIIYQPVDEFLSAYRSKWAKKHPFFALNPAVVTSSEVSYITTIGKDRDFAKKDFFIQIHPKRLYEKVLWNVRALLATKKTLTFLE